MNIKVYTTILLISISATVFAQSLEEDISILYMKANVLYDSGRYDESVRMYNRILGDDETYAAAYIMRAKAKYELGAYKGTKKDVLKYIEVNGVTKEVIKLMSKTELNLENYKTAKNYVKTALELDPYDSEQYKIGGDIERVLGNDNEACEMWYSASELGDSKSKSALKEYCGIYMKIKKENRDRKQRPSRSSNSEKQKEEEVEEAEVGDDIVDKDDKEMEEDNADENNQRQNKIEAPDMDAIQEIEIDEELSIVIGNGLGKRKIENQPDIFMLADETGRVVIDVCVDGRGKVKLAELNKDQTSIYKAGLVSLALRKSKEFSFFPSFRTEQCGQLIFMISAGQ